jgi:hypothetical protein
MFLCRTRRGVRAAVWRCADDTSARTVHVMHHDLRLDPRPMKGFRLNINIIHIRICFLITTTPYPTHLLRHILPAA